jgi:hypothetical protein
MPKPKPEALSVPEPLPSLRDVADRARVMGECFVCAGLVECEHPGLCGYEGRGDGQAE